MNKSITQSLVILVAVLVAVLAIAVVRALTVSSVQVPVDPVEIAVDDEAVIRLSHAIRFPTIADPSGATDPAPFEAFHEFLRDNFPKVHQNLTLERVSELTLHYRWPGTDASAAHVVLLAHQDVVPVEGSTEKNWTHPPFSGVIADGYVWGRGALDNKLSVLGMLEAAEALLDQGFRPSRTIHLLFGHDEEVSGTRGALVAARKLGAEGVQVEAVLDEGLVIADGIVPGVSGRVALVGISEKGYLTVRLTARAQGGHSSMPPRDLAVVKLARALERLAGHPMTASLEGPAAMMFDALAAEMDFGYRLLFANRWLFGAIIKGQMEGGPSTNALLRTTMAPTMLSGSPRENVLPQMASATINFRIHPRDSIDTVLAYVGQVIDDEDITVEPVGDFRSDSSPLASVETPFFATLSRSIREVYGDIPVAPGLVLAATDSRHFTTLTPNVYRFLPVTLKSDELSRIHGTDERVRVEDYLNAIRLYRRLIEGL
jgi:carboxypeptidase PM20D1